MNAEEFVELVCAQTGMHVGTDHLDLPFDALPAWDSMYLLTVATAVEARTGRSLNVADALECASLGQLRNLVGA
ncbi:acyl carrier protein [Rhodococcus pyridinivorans]|uniref:phosphopantetheine-binding protein n=1 Tax=Rhodococcus TaxID=1827 RepID=UPI0007EB3239|nr:MULTISPECIES: phosphopantetheine-binding protein [Rhodococcus]APE07950.1 hypothetical protein BO226_00855 [Rhodococcus sp. 2G]MCD2116028.1 acyl carrier protein [Rhodococcus pyridinivorans]MCW3469039.1 acyl carrier protein [Rhodococcus pyridinivorans]MCZ4624892.1 acyl carrier protein [Rhodococcus pyridinivorans]MCZ4646102.1 acyl carrier protein [Rhodococcus pyridinivorans]